MEGRKQVEVHKQVEEPAEAESCSAEAAVLPPSYEWSHGTNPVGSPVRAVEAEVPMQALLEEVVAEALPHSLAHSPARSLQEHSSFSSAVRRNQCRTWHHRGLSVHISRKKA